MEFILAILPVIALCLYIYKKDVRKEPKGLLFKLFILGVLICFPVAFAELIVSKVFPVEEGGNFIVTFINVFISVALMEEGFKWLITKFCGYNSKEFDEIYDIIVYAVFVSLGFACLENILYVFSYGVGNAILRAFTSIPGHCCFGIIMGYFLSKARVNELNGNKSNVSKNLLLSIFMPTLLHTIYDAILFAELNFFIFLAFHIGMVSYCFILVNKMSRVQYNISYNTQYLYNNYVNNVHYDNQYNNQNNYGYNMMNNPNQFNMPNNTNVTAYNQFNNNNVVQQNNMVNNNFCPMCGSKNNNYSYCPYCGYKMK